MESSMKGTCRLQEIFYGQRCEVTNPQLQVHVRNGALAKYSIWPPYVF